MLKRFPKIGQILPVYAVGVTTVFSWAIITTVKEIFSNWSLYFGVADILSLFAYVMVGAFLESLLLIFFLLMIGFVLPRKIFLDKFVLRGTVLIISFLVTIMYYYTQTPMGEALENTSKLGIFFILTLILMTLGESIPIVDKFVNSMANRFVIFLYIYLPVSFISILTIIFRNLG
ncbi:MAG: hypothetical protein IH588_06230 [Anaerolineales bacterium]|nr:hypothetical protein [Anaerolineales bacterium]